VAFFYSHHSNNIRNRNFDTIFLNDNLEVNPSIKIDTSKTIFIADFSTIEQDTTKYFSHVSYETVGSWRLKKINNYYRGPNFGFGALIIRDYNFVQLKSPFPYYQRTIYKSKKQHPEQGLFLGAFLTQSWTIEATVQQMNKKLNDYYNRKLKEK